MQALGDENWARKSFYTYMYVRNISMQYIVIIWGRIIIK